MTDKAAIDGDYCDFRLVRTRKVCQVVVEFPIERAGEVTQALGWPKPDGTTRCAVALINDGVMEGAATREDAVTAQCDVAGSSALKATSPSAKSPRKWADLPPSSRAALLCKEPEFWGYLSANGYMSGNEHQASATLKSVCGVSSRAEIVKGSRAAAELSRIIGNYNAWKQAKGLGAI
jgi:hypothetical protein